MFFSKRYFNHSKGLDMAQSMTAYARVDAQDDWGQVAWEIRSVNHRYLEVAMRLPEMFRKWEIQWRDLLKKHLKRGKVECVLTYQNSSGRYGQMQVDTELLDQLLHVNRQIGHHAQINTQLSTVDLLSWPGLIVAQNQEFDLEQPLTQLLDQALAQLVEVREREGRACVETIYEKIQKMENEVKAVVPILPEIEKNYREKLKLRLAEVAVEVDTNRFEQEVVIFLQRIDVAEELDRLTIHLNEVKRVLEQPGSIGRRLDFLMQELNREANTLASKAAHPKLTQGAIELKVYIEQIREQIQNME